MSERWILHVDMDAFYAAVEVLDHPSLAGRPVVVGAMPRERGVVATASYEARRYGVRSAMSPARARRLCPQAVFLRPRFDRYLEVADQIQAIFRSFTPLVESVSIDEAFLDVTGCERLFGPAEQIARRIKQRIRDEIGLTASVGVAPNKFLAKLASDLEKPDGFVVIRPDEVEARLAPLGVERIWGVGKATASVLARLGIHTIGQLRDAPTDALEARLGPAMARHLARLARGIDDTPVVPESEAKSIGNEITFPADIAAADALREQLDWLVDRVARRLRASGRCAQTIRVKARFSDFRTVTRERTLPAPTSATLILREAARDLLEHAVDRRGRPLRLLGVAVDHLQPPDRVQPELWVDPQRVKAETLDRLMDRLRQTHGVDAVRLGQLSLRRATDMPPLFRPIKR